MSKYCLTHLSGGQVESGLTAVVARERGDTAEAIAYIAEFDARQLYVPAGFSSMFAYGVHVLHFSPDAMYKRITAARAARQFPAIFAALAEGRLHLSGLVELAPHLTPENAAELLAAATHRTRAEIEMLMAERFPRPDVAARVQALSPSAASKAAGAGAPGKELAPGRVQELQSGAACAPPYAKVAPLSAERFALQVTISRDTHENLRYAQALLGHAVPTGDLAEVLDRALEALVTQLEKRKFAATTRPRRQGSSEDPRRIPAAVKRAVWERDGGQCGFVGTAGQRCPALTRLEYDHVDPVARGGEATVDGIRLRCRAHNQYEAECVFGAGFMATKREAAQQAAAEARAAKRAAAEERARAAEAEQDPDRSVVPWLRRLGVHLKDARELAARCEGMADAPMEERIRAALRHLATRTVSRSRAA